MTTLKQNRTTSAPFLAVVSFPTVYHKRFTRRKLWKGPKGQPTKLEPKLEPGNIAGPTKTSYVTMGSFAKETQSESAMQNNKRSSAAQSSGDETCVILSKWLPLRHPTFLPSGIMGDPTLGVAGMRAMYEHYLEADEETLRWLDEPISQEWLTTVATDPQAFSTH